MKGRLENLMWGILLPELCQICIYFPGNMHARMHEKVAKYAAICIYMHKYAWLCNYFNALLAKLMQKFSIKYPEKLKRKSETKILCICNHSTSNFSRI